MRIGAKDGIDRALVKQYAQVKTTNFDEPRIAAEEMWKNINLIAMNQKIHINMQPRQKVS